MGDVYYQHLEMLKGHLKFHLGLELTDEQLEQVMFLLGMEDMLDQPQISLVDMIKIEKLVKYKPGELLV